MKISRSRGLLFASCVAVLLALGACNRGDQTAGQQLDSASANAKEKSQDAAARARAASKKAGDETKAMGSSAAAKVDDGAITSKVNEALAADKDLSAAKIDVDTKNGVVTLTGPAPSARARDHATDLARNVKGVNSVNNKLTVKAG